MSSWYSVRFNTCQILESETEDERTLIKELRNGATLLSDYSSPLNLLQFLLV